MAWSAAICGTDLDTETAAYLRDAPRTWQEADARAVSDFVAERIRGYVDRPTVAPAPCATMPFRRRRRKPIGGLVVTGESGCGKSSLFGTLYKALHPRAAAGEILLLSHAAGIFPMSGQVDRMLRRWIGELSAYLGVVDPLEKPAAGSPEEMAGGGRPGETTVTTSEQIEKTFAGLLHQVAANVRVVVLIDALNQFEPTVRAGYLTWLPEVWPANARLLATSYSRLRKRRPQCPFRLPRTGRPTRRLRRSQGHR